MPTVTMSRRRAENPADDKDFFGVHQAFIFMRFDVRAKCPGPFFTD